MAIDLGRLKNKKTIIFPVIWERDASRKALKGFTIDSRKISNFVNLNSNMIELKKSASRWTRTRRKISPIEWRKMSTFDFKKNWWISLNNSGKAGPVRDRSDFNDALTSKTVYTKNLEKNNSGQFNSGNTSNGTHLRVLHPAGGNGTFPGGAHDNKKESPRMSLHAKRHDGTERPVVCRLWTKPQTWRPSRLFFCCS